MKEPLKRTAWFVYMLECKGGRIYTGISPDVAARFAKHRAGQGGAFTRSFPPRRILAAMRCASRGEALSAEHGLKQLERPEKLAWARCNAFRTSSPRKRGPRSLDSRFRGNDEDISRGRLRRPLAARGSRR